jgi:SAM-dependent methyltransferase
MWKIKVLIQFLLSKFSKGEKINYILQRINKSHNEDKIMERIVDLLKSMKKINKQIPLKGATVVEIGTGWEPICSVLLYLMGVKICHTYDHVRHVRPHLAKMLVRIIDDNLDEISKITSISLSTLKKRVSKLKIHSNLDDYFLSANIVYHAPGDASRTDLEEGSVDLVYSHAVLEHVSKKTVYDLTLESKRVLKKTGIAYHLIGEHDHYSDYDKKISKVNFLKYSEFWWSFFIKNKISYHNRLREKNFLSIFKECNAKIVCLENKTEPNDINILRNMKIDNSFNGMSYEELAIYETELIMSFPREVKPTTGC